MMVSQIIYEATFEMTTEQCRVGVRRYLGRTIGWGWWVVGATIILVLGAEYALGQASFTVVPWAIGWLGRAALVLAILYVLVIVMLYWMMLCQAKKQVRKLESPKVWLGVSEDGLSMRTSEADVSLKWRAFLKLWRFGDVWLLFQNQSVFIILPVPNMQDDMRKFVVKHLESVGCKVD